MWRRTRGLVSVAVLLVTACGGCGDDDGGGTPVDASMPDAEAPDADPNDMCPGQLTFEAGMTDLISKGNLCEVTVVDVDDANNSVVSAPNGRVVMCLPSTGVHQVRATRTGVAAVECAADLLPHVQTVDSAAAALHRPQPFLYEMLAEAEADGFVAGLPGITARDAGATQLFVAVRTEPGGAPLTGAQVSLANPGDGAFVRDANGDFEAGDTLGTDATVLFANVPVSPAPQITVTTPGGETCTGPTTFNVEAGLSSVFFSCQ